MKAAIYNPYLDTLGGGERYTMAVATSLVKAGYKVYVEWKDPEIAEKIEKRFGIKLDGVEFIENINRGDGYDVCFWVSDGSVPTLKARKNFLHFQVPFHNVNGKSLINKMKLYRVEKVICNSEFTKKVIDKEYGVSSVVLYPPVSVEKIKAKRKENSILFVGRFSTLKQSKGQDTLIKAFKKISEYIPEWKLILAGGTEVGASDLESLKKEAKGYQIEFVESPDFKKIVELFGTSKIFWSASGFGVDENKNPEKVEHFGITTVEAMAAGAVPFVYNAGGHKESVHSGENGYLWTSVNELVKKTTEVIRSRDEYNKLSLKARADAQQYSYERFEKELLKLL